MRGARRGADRRLLQAGHDRCFRLGQTKISGHPRAGGTRTAERRHIPSAPSKDLQAPPPNPNPARLILLSHPVLCSKETLSICPSAFFHDEPKKLPRLTGSYFPVRRGIPYRHSKNSVSSPSRTTNVLPSPGSLVTETSPPYFIAMCLTMDRPSPVPPGMPSAPVLVCELSTR